MAAMNPILTEIQGLSPAAKGALGMAGHTLPTPEAVTSATAPPTIAPGMLLPHPDAGPPPGPISMGPSPTPLTMPSASPDLVTGPKRGQAMMTNGESAPMGTMAGDSAERSRLLSTGSGISQIGSRIENSRLGEAHPFLGKLLGGLAQGAATIGDIGLSAVAPSIAINTPGTEYHHQALLNHADKAVSQDVGDAQKQAQTASENATAAKTNAETPEIAPEAEARIGVQNATAGHENAETAALANPKGEWKELTGFTGANGEPLEINGSTGETRSVATQGAKATNKKESTPQQETYDSLISGGMTPIQAYEKIREKPAGTTVNTGTWTLDEDENGKPTLFNTKTGETRAAPTGIQKSGTHAKAQAAEAGPRQALEYANDYGSRSLHTGPGDEALMEKFFELAKPSTGFRMSQPQIDMLKNAQSWMGGLEAHLRHATTGTWFSDEQRGQIVGTMQDLAKAKGLDAQGQPNAQPGNSTAAENWVRGPDGKLVKQ
jgi:hypothetical protein